MNEKTFLDMAKLKGCLALGRFSLVSAIVLVSEPGYFPFGYLALGRRLDVRQGKQLECCNQSPGSLCGHQHLGFGFGANIGSLSYLILT